METVSFDFPQSHRALGERLYLQGASFCFKDLSFAATCLAQAERAPEATARELHLDRARESVNRVLRVLPRLALNDEDFESVCVVIDRLHARLQRIAPVVRPN